MKTRFNETETGVLGTVSIFTSNEVRTVEEVMKPLKKVHIPKDESVPKKHTFNKTGLPWIDAPTIVRRRSSRL